MSSQSFHNQRSIEREELSLEVKSILYIHDRMPGESIEDKFVLQSGLSSLIQALQEYDIPVAAWAGLQQKFDILYCAIQDAGLQLGSIVNPPLTQYEWNIFLNKLETIAAVENRIFGPSEQSLEQSTMAMERLTSIIKGVCAQFLAEAKVVLDYEIENFKMTGDGFNSFEMYSIDRAILTRVFFLTTLELVSQGEEAHIGDSRFLSVAAGRLDQILYGRRESKEQNRKFSGLKGILLQNHTEKDTVLALSWFKNKIIHNLKLFDIQAQSSLAIAHDRDISSDPIKFNFGPRQEYFEFAEVDKLVDEIAISVKNSLVQYSPGTQVAFSEILPHVAGFFHGADCFRDESTSIRTGEIVKAAHIVWRWVNIKGQLEGDIGTEEKEVLMQAVKEHKFVDELERLCFFLAQRHEEDIKPRLNAIFRYLRERD